MNTIEDLRAALDYPDPPARPDSRAIIARGRRRRVVRRAAVGGALAAVVAAVVAVNPFGGTQQVRPGVALVGTVPEPALVAAMATGPDEAPVRFDPLVRTLHVGWIPAGLKDEQAEIGTTEQSFSGFDEGCEDCGTDLGLVVTVLAKGQPPTGFTSGALGLPMGAVERETDDINGRPAVCLSDPAVRGSCSALRWQYAPDGWARVSYAGSRGRTPEAAAAVARTVAESVRLTAAEPVRLPFTLTGATAGLHPARTLVRIAKPGSPRLAGEVWSADICLVDSAAEADRPYGERRQLVVGVRQAVDPSGRTGSDPEPNTTVDGHDARRSDRELIVWNGSGARIFTSYENRDGDPTAAYHDLRLVGGSADPVTWPAVRR